MVRFSLSSIALSAATLVFVVGIVRSHEMPRSAASKNGRGQAAEETLIRFYIRSVIDARAELRFEDEVGFRAAEALYQRKLYPYAAKFYRRLLDSASKYHRKRAIQRLYEIAAYWLQDSWGVIKQGADFKPPDWLAWVYPYDMFSEILPDPKTLFHRTLVCRNLLHWDDSKPYFNEEGRAVELLRCVHDRQPKGPFADKTLYLMGYLAWFHEDYRRADECFSRLEKKHPASPFSPHVIDLAIKAKLMRDETEGERQRIEEARRLIRKGINQPNISVEKEHSLLKLAACVTARLSDMDFQEAENAHLAGRLDEARSRYQRVCEDYPATYTADMAKKRLKAMKRAK